MCIVCNAIAQDTTKVLFIGNSITYFNDMPNTFEDIANSLGNTTEVTVYAPGGTGFIHHVNDANVYSHFRQGDWDYVILQPGSNESPGYSEPIDQTLARARILKDSVVAYNPCAKILFYEISYGVWGSSQGNLDTYNETMDLIRANLELLADSTELAFVPAGESVRTVWNTDQTTLLWGSAGDIHPNAKGSYIIACTFYSAIFQSPSSGSNITTSLTPTEAVNYQLLADTITLNNLSDWRINTYDQFTDFEFNVDGQDVVFNSLSEHIDSLVWNLGDGNTNQLDSFNYSYNTDGDYTVTLTTYKNNCEQTVSKTVQVSNLGVEESLGKDEVIVYPNPFSSVIYIRGNVFENVSVYNTLGQDLSHLISVSNRIHEIEVNTSQLPVGGYFIKILNFNTFLYKK